MQYLNEFGMETTSDDTNIYNSYENTTDSETYTTDTISNASESETESVDDDNSGLQLLYADFDEEICDEIYDNEQDDYAEAIDKNYYIGCCKYLKKSKILLFANRISISTFYDYSRMQICEYLYWYSGMFIANRINLEIMQLDILPDNTYTAILKTFWIKIIQRVWKKIYQKRRIYILCRKKLGTLRNVELGQKLSSFPGLRGMLSAYRKSCESDECMIIQNY